MMTRSGLVLLLLLAHGGVAHGWDDPWAVRPDGELSPHLSLQIESILPVTRSPAETNSFRFGFAGAVGYVDDDKSAELLIGTFSGFSTWRQTRSRYEPTTTAAIGVFDVEAQWAALPHLHLLYGAAVLRTGTRVHGRAAAICGQLGVALPLLGDRSSMRSYHRAHLQVETLPVVLSLLGFLDLEGASDREAPAVGASAEVALAGRLEVAGHSLEGDLRLLASYVVDSLYVEASIEYLGPVLFWRVAPAVEARYTWPARPLRQHLSEPTHALIYGHHVGVTVGLRILL